METSKVIREVIETREFSPEFIEAMKEQNTGSWIILKSEPEITCPKCGHAFPLLEKKRIEGPNVAPYPNTPRPEIPGKKS